VTTTQNKRDVDPATTVEGNEPWASAAQALLDETGCAIVKWRSNLTGTSYIHKPEIEVPRPKTAKSFAVFAHEIGHQRLHRANGNYPHWREEVEAWEFALAQFSRFGLKGGRKIRPWVRQSVHYAFHKATRRGVEYETIRKAYPQWDWAK
jgi:hypothetical protein